MKDAIHNVWAMVYAATMQGILTNPDNRYAWEEVRGRCEIEADRAVKAFYKAHIPPPFVAPTKEAS